MQNRQKPGGGLSPKLRPKGTNLMNPQGTGKDLTLEMHERVYKLIMEIGSDNIKDQYMSILAELMIEVADILDK